MIGDRPGTAGIIARLGLAVTRWGPVGFDVSDLNPAAFAQGVLDNGTPRPGVVVLDARTAGEVASGRLLGATPVDISDPRFAQKAGLMARDRPVYVDCAVGGRSASAAARLVSMGFAEVYNLDGGIVAWKRAGLPVERGVEAGAGRANTSPEAFDAVVAKHATVLVDFETPWCAPCKRMAPRVEAIAAARGLQLLRVDIDAREALAVREDIVGVPVLALYRDGKRVWRHAGELDEAALAAALAAATGR